MQEILPVKEDNLRNKWLTLISLGIGVFMSTLDSSIVNISLPNLVQNLKTDFATVQWVVIAYVLVLSSLILSIGRLGDMYDKKRIYLSGMVIFTIGSLLCGLAPGVYWLIAFRALQGLGATMMQALGMAMVTQAFPPEERGRALGIMGSIVSVGIAVGPPIGGILIGLAGWRSVFLVNVPVGIIGLIMVSNYVSSSLPPVKKQNFDYAGGFILFLTLGAYALGMTIGQNLGFSSNIVIVLFISAFAGIVIFVVAERRIRQPMVELSLFNNLFFSLSLLMGFLVFHVLACSFILPFFLELVKHYPAELVGMLLMVMPFFMGIIAPIAGGLSDRFGPRGISLLGLVAIGVGALVMSTIHKEVTPLGFVLRMAPFGIGMGLFQSPNNSAVMGSVPRHRLGIASSLLSLSRTLGNASGIPLMGAIFSIGVQKAVGLPKGFDITTVPADAIVAGVNGTYRLAAYLIFTATCISLSAFFMASKRQTSPAVEKDVYLNSPSRNDPQGQDTPK